MKAYLDTSAIVTLLLQEDSDQPMRRWLAATEPIVAISTFGWGELASAIALNSAAMN